MMDSMKWDPLVHRTLAVLKKQFAVRRGDRLLAAVSGGADSICMLHLLHTLSSHLDIRLRCVHVHHGIRGDAADRDAAFVRGFCKERGIPFVLKEVDAPAYRAAHPHVSLEEAARQLRYRALAEAAGDRTFICTAHNADDNAETVLLNLFRGGGIRAFAGIPAARGNILRPLLSVTRAEIEAYNRKHKLSFVTDETNTDTAFARNAIRHELLPLAKEKINAQSALHLAENAEVLRLLVHFLDTQAKEGLARCKLPPAPAAGECAPSASAAGAHEAPFPAAETNPAASPAAETDHAASALSVRTLRKEDPFLQGEILRLFLSDTPCGAKDITRTHITDVLALVHSDNGKASLSLPGGLLVTRTHDVLICLISDGVSV